MTMKSVTTRNLEDNLKELESSCGNCQREFVNETRGISEINLQSNCYDGGKCASDDTKTDDGVITGNHITVLQALSSIYGYPLTNSGPDGVWRESDNCTLCDTCAVVLSNFYQAFQQLRRLANEASYISQGLNQLHKNIKAKFSSQEITQENKDNSRSQINNNNDSRRCTRRRQRPNKKRTSTLLVKEGDDLTNDDENSKKTARPDQVDANDVGENGVPMMEVKIEELQPFNNYDEGEDFTIEQLPESKRGKRETAPIPEKPESVIGTTEVISPNGKIIRTSTRVRKARKSLDFGENIQHKPSVKGTRSIVKQGKDNAVVGTDCKEPTKSDVVTTFSTDNQKTYYHKTDLKTKKDGKFLCPKPKCSKAFKGLKTLNKHVLEHLALEVRPDDKSLVHNVSSSSSPANQKRLNRNNKLAKICNKYPIMDSSNSQQHVCEKQYQCEHCDKRFILKNMYDRHLTSHENQRAECRCTVCDQTFPTAVSLARHISCVHDVNIIVNESKTLDYSCPECPSSEKSFENYNDLKSHFESAHKEPLNFCIKCGKSFLTLVYLRCHYKNIHKMQLHSDDHTSTQEIQIKSEQDQEYIEKSTLYEEPGERKRKDADSDKVLKCNQCNKEFKKRQQLNMHILFHNDKEPRFGCSKCPKKFFQPNGLRKHMLVHTMENPLICKECDKVFERHDHFKRHVEMVHNQNKPKTRKKIDPRNDPDHTCKECHKTFSRKEYLSLHMRIHTGEKPHMCSICGKQFRDPRNLAQHLVTHKTDRPFCCSVCGLTFKRAHHLNDHEGTHRQNIARPFVCSVAHCAKAFKLRKHLVSHELVHTGSKDHTCHVCGRAFSRKDNLRQHINKIHGKEFADDMQVIVDKQRENYQRSQQSKPHNDTDDALKLENFWDQVTTSNDGLQIPSPPAEVDDLLTGNDQISEVYILG